MTAPTYPDGPGSNTGHGHAWPRPDRRKYRCGGTRMCSQCKHDAELWQPSTVWTNPHTGETRTATQEQQ
ncbi:MAG: hypothetical protein ACRDQA_10305 [Nocardioidaceae bacterium]